MGIPGERKGCLGWVADFSRFLFAEVLRQEAGGNKRDKEGEGLKIR